ncbi:MAG: transglutaminase-like cysteine peptidase [Beijerinckiaceae bacterium]
MRLVYILSTLMMMACGTAASANVYSANTPPGRPGQKQTAWQPVMAPMAHIRFCVAHEDQCQRQRVSIRKPRVALTASRMQQMQLVNSRVNRSIKPRADRPDRADVWTLAPRAGDCDDFAVTKRAQLLAMGWPSSALLLTHTTAASGEDHLVLTVRTTQGEFILDNLHTQVRPAHQGLRPIIKIQSALNPGYWLAPARASVAVVSQAAPKQHTVIAALQPAVSSAVP